MTQPTNSRRQNAQDALRIRQSQALYPYGTGAMLNVDGEWFVAVDTRRWGDRGIRLIREPRLMSYLHVSELRAPPIIEKSEQADLAPFKDESVPFYRFPEWMFCPTCHRMQRWQRAREFRFCSFCADDVRLSPMPFVQICGHGHLQDVDWAYWVHLKDEEEIHKGDCRSDDEMEYRFSSSKAMADSQVDDAATERDREATTSLGYVECQKCRARKYLRGLIDHGAYRFHCAGRQPWQSYDESQDCDSKQQQFVELGSSDLWYPVIERSLDIPPNSDATSTHPNAQRIFGHAQFAELKARLHEKGRSRRAVNLATDIAVDVAVTQDDVLSYAERDLAEGTADIQAVSRREELLPGEVEAFLHKDRLHHPRDRFIKRFVSIQDAPASPRDPLAPVVHLLKETITAVVQVQRLRMVMAYKGFTRVLPLDGQDLPPAERAGSRVPDVLMIRPDLTSMVSDREPLPWLPAIDLYGEGIFFSFDLARINAWAHQKEVGARWAILRARQLNSPIKFPEAQPTFGLLHTLSHLLIRQMSYEAGYSLTALNERLYVLPEQQQYGLLIYTATIDSLGTLGGLVRLAEPERLFVLVLKALQRGLWCSGDPLCGESIGQGMGGLNLAACHACTLLPETSCEHNNTLLDRAALFGTPDGSVPGYFDDVIASLPGSEI